MRKDITVAAEPRATRGKEEAGRMRRLEQKIPAVVYGTGKDPVAVTVNPKEISRILHSSSGYNTIFNLDVPGVENSPVMVIDSQRGPLKGNLLHVDFKRIDLAKRLAVKVPVHTTGEPRGVKQQGGLYEIVTREVLLECLPDDIPEALHYDVTELELGQNVRASQLALAETVKLLSPPDQVISHVVAVRATAEAATTDEAAPAAAGSEPEVIKKGKKEEEAAAAEKKKK